MKKIVKIVVIILIVVIGGLIAVPFIFKDKILAMVKSEINNNIDAKVDFTDYDLGIFKSFPNLTISLSGLEVIGVNEFAGDTLAAIGLLDASVDVMSVISGDQINIRSVGVNDAVIHLIVLKDGKANWDISKPSTETDSVPSEPSKFDVGLKKYTLSNCLVTYEDASLGFKMRMEEMNHEGDGDFTQDLFTLHTTTTVAGLTASYEGVTYLNEAVTKLDADLEMDMVKSKYTFRENELMLNDLGVSFDGYVMMPDESIEMDLKFGVKKNSFASFLSMIPGVYKEGFDNVTSSGNLEFNGFVKGVYNDLTMPGFGITLKIDKGMFRYPDLPTALNNVQVDLNISNPDGVPDHTLINLSKLHLELGSEPFDARMVVKTPVSDADIDATIKGRIDLANMSKLVPLDAGTELSGNLTANVTAIGRMSAIDNKRYEDFNANGVISLQNFTYKSADFTQGVSISECELIFNPKNVTLNKFAMTTGGTDLRATGWLDNLLAYTFKEKELLKGTLDIRSNTINLNDYLTDTDPNAAAADTTPLSVIEIPEYIDFLITFNAGKVIYDDLELLDTKGNIAMRDRTLGINGFSCNVLEGQLKMDGLYETKDVKNPYFFLDFRTENMDIKQTYDKFVAVQKLAPIAEKCNGRYSSAVNVKGNFDSRMEPVYTSLSGGGKLSTQSVNIVNFTPLVKLADNLKMDQFKQLAVSDVNLSFKFENGRVNVAPFDVVLGGIKSTVQGSNGFDETIDYLITMNVPVSKMGSGATGVVTGLLNQANQKAGTNLSLGNEVKINAHITGTVSDPKIETGLKEAAGNMATDVKTQVIEQFNQTKQEVEDKAKAEAERLKQEAEAKAKAEADRLKKEAEDRAKAESDKLKKEIDDKVKKEAEDKLKNLFKKPK